MMQENPSSQEARELPNPKGSQQRVARRQLTVASPERVPKEIAVCPECGGGLWWQVETTDGVRDLSLDCENEPDIDENEDMYHRWWQGEWQPVIDRVKRWVVAGLSPSSALSNPESYNTAASD